MPVFRKIQISFWQDPFILELPFEEKAFYLYLLTNSKTKQCGIYEISVKVIELETGLNREKIEQMLDKFIDTEKIKYDNETKEIMILNWLKHNSNTSPTVQTCITKELKSVKSKSLLNTFDTVDKEYLHTMDTVSQEEKEKEKKELKEDEKEAQFLVQITTLHNIWNINLVDEEKDLCRLLISKYGFERVRDVFNKAADKGNNFCNLNFVMKALRE